MQLWFQASSVASAVGSSVDTWRDDSGNVNDATQDTASMQPTLQVVTFAGKTFPVLRFDSVDDGMQTPLVIADVTPFSSFVLWRLASPAVFTGAILSSDSMDWSIGNLNAQMLCYFDSWSAAVPVNNAGFYLIETRIMPGDDPNIFLNGVACGIPGGGSVTPNGIMLGASGLNGYPGNCDCAEILIYDRLLSDAEAAGVRAYFQDRYNYLKL